MASSSDDHHSWSDTSAEDEVAGVKALQSRAYQIEMFEQSMQGNIIAVMAPGSGKTQIAKLRIEAELQRTVGKRVWFMAPSVVLAYQQHLFLSQQLPAAQFKLITGRDSPDYWRSRQAWDKVLLNVDVVVCTPAILLNALDDGFVSLGEVSLIVADEAHHCVKKDPLNTIMKNYYHPFSSGESFSSVPAILGLSASPVTKKSISELPILEENLGARCVAPSKQLGEYTTFVNAPKLQITTYSQKPCPSSLIVSALATIVNQLTIEHDPFVSKLRCQSDLKSQEKLKKILKNDKTPAMAELHSFLRSAIDLLDILGPWAARAYITTCLIKIQVASSEALRSANHSDDDFLQFICRTLEPLYTRVSQTYPNPSGAGDYSEKVGALIKLLVDEYRPTTRALIFIKTRPAAWALTSLLQAHLQTQEYRPFSFVGCSNPSHRNVFDFAQPVAQNEALEDFRRGELNLCVATSVMEEGIDVPAMNLVICFDEPSNLRGFVQSRGRARQQESKFIMFRELGDDPAKLVKWRTVEEEMKLACAEEEKDWEERRVSESQEEIGGEIFRIPTTGATLTYENSQQRLQRFCSKVSRHAEPVMTNPVYVISGATNVDVRATVHLPNTLDPDLRVFGSKLAWRTEKMAKRDAAFQAYKSLYESDLVTDNLIPPNIPKEDALQEAENRKIEKRDSVYSIAPQYDPWPEVMNLLATSPTLYSHEIQTTSADKNFPSMSLLLPMKLDQCFFSLYESSSQRISVSIASGVEIPKSLLEISRKISFYLLSTILGRRLRGAEADQVPLILIPNVFPEMLQGWYDRYGGSNPFADCMLNGALSPQGLLLKVGSRNVPYIFRTIEFEGADRTADTATVGATKLSRKLDYLSLQGVSQQATITAQESFAAADCQVLDLPAEYGHLMLLVPSMTHMLEVFLRSTEACKGPLSALAFQGTNLVSEALTLSTVSTTNYQRLEFLGDDLLKYYASTQVFVDNPKHPEGLLTVYTNRIVANSRLQRATRSLGLDKFLTRVKFSGQDWSAGVRPEESRHDTKGPGRYLSSKVLADVIEALIGAAYVDGATQDMSEEKVIAALKLFINEISWRTPAENIAKLVTKSSGIVAEEKLEPVEGMLGYRFKQSHLLAEALTHSSYNPGISSYDRLEFLGDAVLDHIVKIRLYQNDELLSPAEMTLRRHALVSHATLSFFALQASHILTTTNIEVDLDTKKTTETEVNRTVYLPDHIRLIDSREMCKARKKTLSTWKEVQPRILHAFEHGKTFPWARLLSLDAPKSYSDVIESILGAVFVDSGARLEACEQVLEKLGYMKLVTRVTSARKGEVNTTHPEEALHEMATNAQLVAQKTSSGWRCKVLIEDERVAYATRASCKEEARCKAAKRAVKFWNSNKKRKLEIFEPSNGDGEMVLESSVLG